MNQRDEHSVKLLADRKRTANESEFVDAIIVEPDSTDSTSATPEPAPLDRRRLNCLIDGLVAGLLAVLATQGYGWLVLQGASQRPGDGVVRLPPNFWLGFFIVAGVVWAAYFFVMELAWGRTLGKLISGTKVVSEDGSPASETLILTRSLARLIPLEFLTFIGQADRRGLHDTMSQTMVILCRQGPSEEEDPLFD